MSDLSLRHVVVGADFTLLSTGGLLAHGTDLVVAVVVVNDILDSQGNGCGHGGEGGDADLSVDRGVGIPTLVLRLVPIGGCGWVGVGVSSQGHEGQESQDESLKKTGN